MKKVSRLSSLTRNQQLVLRATRVAQQTIRLASLGKIKPHWVLPLAGHFCTRNRTEEKSKTGDSEPGPTSLRWHKEIIKHMNTSRYKRRALVPNLY
jgi:hypothetical protein